MIITDKIEILVTNNTKKYYTNLGYHVNEKNLCVSVNDLSKNSRIEIEVKCDCCGDEKKIQYRNYLKSKENNDKYYCNKCGYKKSEETYFKKNNIKCIFLDSEFINETKFRHQKNRNLLDIQKKIKKDNKRNTLLNTKKIKFIEAATQIHNNKYNYSLVEYKTNKNKVEIICNICGEHFFQSPSNHVNHKQNCSYCDGKLKIVDNSFKEYKNMVRKETYKYKKELLKNWNGFDFYDNEYIIEYYKLDRCDNRHPSIDHKISIKFGFDNKLAVEKIGHIDNLCITKRILNIKKGK